MQRQKSSYKYAYNGEVVSKEQFENLTEKWFGTNTVEYSSVSNFFDGENKKNTIFSLIKDRTLIPDQSISNFETQEQKDINTFKEFVESIIESEKHNNDKCLKVQQKEKLELLREHLLSQPTTQNDFNIITKILLSETEDELKNVISAKNMKTEDIINKPMCAPQCFCDGNCKKPQPLDNNKECLGWQIRRGKPVEYNRTEPQKGKKETGEKHNKGKLPMSKLFVQFPDALQAVVLASCYGHNKYKEVDANWLNFKKVPGGSQTYKDACLRHSLGAEKDEESGLPEIVHQAWNKLAELQLWLEENNINIKKFSKEYLDNLK